MKKALARLLRGGAERLDPKVATATECSTSYTLSIAFPKVSPGWLTAEGVMLR
jgi:hypothetical protein